MPSDGLSRDIMAPPFWRVQRAQQRRAGGAAACLTTETAPKARAPLRVWNPAAVGGALLGALMQTFFGDCLLVGLSLLPSPHMDAHGAGGALSLLLASLLPLDTTRGPMDPWTHGPVDPWITSVNRSWLPIPRTCLCPSSRRSRGHSCLPGCI